MTCPNKRRTLLARTDVKIACYPNQQIRCDFDGRGTDVFSHGVSGTALGILLVLAAASETRMLHDRLEAVGRSLESDATPVSNQDLPTLLVALVAIPVGLIAVNVIKRLKTRGLFETTDRDLLAAKVIAAARVTFLAAMLLDTFDDMVTDLAWTTLPNVLFANHVLVAGAKLDGFAKSLCNTTKEILEFGAAVLLLSGAKVFAFDAKSRSAAIPAQ